MGWIIGKGIGVPFRLGGSGLGSSYWSHLYISNLGDDTKDGHTEANAITPDGLALLTIIKGQKIHFKKGETFENISLNISVDDVTIDSYGTGANPIIQGSEVILTDAWTDEGGGIYSLAKDDVKWLYIDDEIVENAKTNYIAAASYPDTNQIQVSAANTTYLNGFTDLVGKKLRIFEYNWRMSFEYTITGYSSGLITLDRDVSAQIGNRFFIYNYDEFLTDESWIWDGTTIKFKTALTLADHEISVGLNDFGLNITGDNCTIENIELKHYQKADIKTKDGATNIINCTIHDGRGSGIYICGHLWGGQISNNTIYNKGNNGVHIGAVNGGSILNNNIYNIGTGVDTSWPITDAMLSLDGYPAISIFGTTDDVTKQCGAGIFFDWDWAEDYALSDSITIQYNTIHDVAAVGMRVSGDNHVIEYNHIYNYNTVFSDGGGIHTIAGGADARDHSCSNIVIKQNIIHNPSPSNDWSFVGRTLCVGIYIDYYSSDIDVNGNIIYDGGYGTEGIYFLTGVTDIRVFNNIIKDFDDICMDMANSSSIKNIKIYDNIFYSKLETMIRIFEDPFADGGYSDRNIFINPYYTTIFKYSTTSYNLADWTTNIIQDANSTIQGPNESAPSTGDCILYANTTNSSVLTNIHDGYKDVNGNIISEETLLPYTGILVLRDYTQISADIIAAWSFDNNALDYSGNGHDGTVSSPGPTLTTGVFGRCYDFAGTNGHNIVVVDSDDLSFTEGGGNDKAFSVSFWLKVDIPANFEFIVSKRGSALSNEYDVLLDQSKISLMLYSADVSKNIKCSIPYTNTDWHFIVITYDGSNHENGINIYIDNEIGVMTKTHTGIYPGMTSTDAPLYIGSVYVGTNTLHGNIDNLKLWDKVITSAEMALEMVNDF